MGFDEWFEIARKDIGRDTMNGGFDGQIST
jgi:hypothetical protein